MFPEVFCIGFAAETHDLEHYAKHKMEQKGLDMIAANPVHNGLGFDQDDNSLHIFWPDGEKLLPKADKNSIAIDLITLIATNYQNKGKHHASS